MKTHVMLDLEFLGFYAGSPLVAIGAMAFNEKQGLIDRFYTSINMQSCFDLGMKPDGDTICWWAMQSEQARSGIFVDNDKAPTLVCALQAFSKWFKEVGGETVWGNGADTDNAYLLQAYHMAGLKAPWGYKDNRCYRTMKSQYPEVKMPERVGTYHNAGDDAANQAIHLLKIGAASGLTLK